ncbi:MAG: response regulator transcription factor [Hahellaceae bacterium]|nr:response regulator transcription factor [Hahellaceae bacterium]MCP5169008.1 response regulator transcription factor [Hahellaceae bacterium]
MNVLIAEDDKHIREGLRDLLEAEGYQCDCAEQGEQALRLFREQSPQIVLLDIMMPVMDGYQVCREIRKQNEQVPVLFITAKSEEIDQVIGLELGADDYIKKPFGTREVIARIRAVTRRYLKTQGVPSQPVEKFVMSDIEVIPSELRAVRSGQVLELSLRDVRILELLHQKRGKVVDRDDLFNHCWGRDYLPSSRTLDQHISKLRKIIELDPKAPLIIQTVHGVGYRFDDLV